MWVRYDPSSSCKHHFFILKQDPLKGSTLKCAISRLAIQGKDIVEAEASLELNFFVEFNEWHTEALS